MKQTYIKPVTEQFEMEASQMVCASNYTFNRYGQWGSTLDQSLYGNNEWVNEGFKEQQQAVGGFTAVEIEDDYGNLETRSNQGFWE